VTIGAHTIGHYALAKLPSSRARAEMRNGARVLEAATGHTPRHFAFPYGSRKTAGQREYELAAELGFRTAVTTVPGVIKAADARTPTAWPRVTMDGYFQSLQYLDVCLSGAPYLVAGRRARAARRPAPAAPVKAAASN
jgi:peptidoglycan/xylan/chitin deacetylase (PgdA/CDA1 family)